MKKIIKQKLYFIPCWGCGKEFDFYKDLGVLDVQGETLPNSSFREFKMTLCCVKCMEDSGADMWTSKEGWNGIKPVKSYRELPIWNDIISREEIFFI